MADFLNVPATITFDPVLTGRTIVAGNLTVRATITIDASAAPGLTLKGPGGVGLFSVTPTGNLTLKGLNLTGGQGATLTTNSAAIGGGAIYSRGTVQLVNDSLYGNGVSVGSSSSAGGGAVLNDGGTLLVTNTTLANNFVSGPTRRAGGGDLEPERDGPDRRQHTGQQYRRVGHGWRRVGGRRPERQQLGLRGRHRLGAGTSDPASNIYVSGTGFSQHSGDIYGPLSFVSGIFTFTLDADYSGDPRLGAFVNTGTGLMGFLPQTGSPAIGAGLPEPTAS